MDTGGNKKRRECKLYSPQLPGSDFIFAVGKARQSNMLEEAERRHLMRLVRSGKLSLLDRALAGVGGGLIAVGARLQQRYRPAVSGCSEVWHPLEVRKSPS